MQEINRRLKSQETEKARKLLTLAMSQFEAFQYLKNKITEDVEKLNGHSFTDE